MRLRVRLLASAGAVVFNGAALAQAPAPGSTPSMEQMVDPFAIRTLPTPGGAPAAKKQSAAAEACANNDGKIAPLARAEACGKLIDSGKWKGGEIAWAYANRCFALFELKSADKAPGRLQQGDRTRRQERRRLSNPRHDRKGWRAGREGLGRLRQGD